MILASRKIEALKEVEKEIQEEGNQATAIVCHTGNMESIAQFFAKIEEQFGNLDILVNNAIKANPYFGPVLNMEEAAFDKTIDVNLKGTFFLSQKAALLMKAGGGGSIINIASINGISPPAMQGNLFHHQRKQFNCNDQILCQRTRSFWDSSQRLSSRINRY